MPAPPRRRPLDALALVRLHEQRTLDALRNLVTRLLAQAMPGASVATLVDDGEGADWAVELALGPDCPLRNQTRVPRDAWQAPGLDRIEMTFRGMPIGEVQILGATGGDDEGASHDAPWLRGFVDHYAAALAKLKLDAASTATVDHYCAGLQAFQEGVVLFREQDPEVTSARFLQLAATLLHAHHATLLAFDRIGDPGSNLRADQILGVPETLAAELLAERGGTWVLDRIASVPEVHCPGDETFPRWSEDSTGRAVVNMITCPLVYHGVKAGLAVFFNVDPGDSNLALKLSTLRGLGELGAALLHRIQLEGEAIYAKGLETQIAIAASIQSRLLPSLAPSNPHWQCAWSSEPSQSIGGDYLDLLDGPCDSVLAILADVSGHGINSALLAASTRAHYRALAPFACPCDALARLNEEILQEVGSTGMFATAVAVSLAADGRAARISSAGHNPTLILRAATKTVEQIDANGPPLGFVPGIDYENSDVALAPGDVLLLYSDGITEATDAADDMFGEERLIECLRAAADHDARTILDAVLGAMDQFIGSPRSRNDDVSIAVFKVVE
ncbi:MAG: PP2C family protein-serine/threonine phosphatase [Planctomycetota bacterium]